MAALNLRVGQTIQTQDGKQGVIKYTGSLHIASGEWLGLELPDSSGKNDGSVKGERYFTCQPGHGIFVRKESVIKILNDAPSATIASPSPGPAAPTKPRPTSGTRTDIARKRQSLMSAGSTGSRLSTRSPTKPILSSGSSATSTPRTGTPATTTRTSDSSAKSRTSVTGRTSMAPPATSARTAAHASRPSIAASTTKTAKPSLTQSKPGTTVRRSPQQSKTLLSSPSSEGKSEKSAPSPAIDEEEEIKAPQSIEARLATSESSRAYADEDVPDEAQSLQTSPPHPSGTTSVPATNGVGSVESRVIQQRDMEQSKARLRTMEKQREEDHERISSLQNDKDRYEGIIKALQSKLKGTQQEVADLRRKCEEAENQADTQHDRSAEHESEMELATLDKEMAEERAETYQLELEALKVRHDELELEIEVLREENKELNSVLSPEERASAGWIQMQRETERLRQALVLLRDMSQENEANYKSEIKELQQNLEEVEHTAGMYLDTTEKFRKLEETNKHLKEQLEAADTNDEIVEAMEAQREHQTMNIERLKKQIQEFEEHIQITDELENFHIDEEKRLHTQLDETEALLNESNRQNLEQDRVIEDLEYTLTKFRDVVQGLQSDIDELRRSRDISELQANEMSSKSRAMMDLNLRLQNNATKSQTKIIETELDKLRADLATKHVEILDLFVPEAFNTERASLMTLLCFSRINSKANLVSKLISDRLRERPHMASGEETFRSYDVIERMQSMAVICRRFEDFMLSCTTTEFIACGSALYEIEPVERTVTAWIEALKRDDLGTDDSEHLKRVQGVLGDLSEKLISQSSATRAAELLAQGAMIECYGDSIAGQLVAIVKLVQARLGGPQEGDDESLVFDKKMDQLSTRARTATYISSKIVQQLNEFRNSLLCLGETTWVLFEEAEHHADLISHQIRFAGMALTEELIKVDDERSLTYTSIANVIHTSLVSSDRGNLQNGSGDVDCFAILSNQLMLLQAMVDNLTLKSSDPNATIPFERAAPPWTIRAKELKSQNQISDQTQEELLRQERRNLELTSRISERDTTIEEMNMRVELAEKRVKDYRARDDKDKELKDELGQLRAVREEANKELAILRSELQTQVQKSERERGELEALRLAAGKEDVMISSAEVVDDRLAANLQLEVDVLEAELTSLRAAVRFLRIENHSLRIPISERLLSTAAHSWLDTSPLNLLPKVSQVSVSSQDVHREATHLYSSLIETASVMKPIKLARAKTHARDEASSKSGLQDGKQQSIWRSNKGTTHYAVLKHREELAKWDDWRDDLLKRAKSARRGAAHSSRANEIQKPRGSGFDSDVRSSVTTYQNVEGVLSQKLPMVGPVMVMGEDDV